MTGSRGPGILLLATALLVAGAAAAVLQSGRTDPAAARRRVDVQRATGGLGLGATLDLSCPHGFDPRLEDACARRHGPLAGDHVTCPHHRGLLPPP